MKIPKAERQARILTALESNPALRVGQLAQQFSVTTETIRRDLATLAKSGQVSRTYGGAVGIGKRFEPALDERLRLQVGERQAIVRRAVELHADNEALLLGGGATMLLFARALSRIQHRLVIITPSIPVAQELATNRLLEVMFLPGVLDAQEQVVTGHATLQAIEMYHAPLAILGASGVDAGGVSEAIPNIGDIYRAMLTSSNHTVILADHGKFEKRALVLLSRWNSKLSLITDRMPAPELARSMRSAGAELVLATPDDSG